MSACYVASTELSPQQTSFLLITTATGRHRNFTYPILLMKKLNLREELLALGPHSWQSVVPRLKPRCEGLQSLCSLMLSMFRTSPPPILLLSLALFLPPLGRKRRVKVCYLCARLEHPGEPRERAVLPRMRLPIFFTAGPCQAPFPKAPEWSWGVTAALSEQ